MHPDYQKYKEIYLINKLVFEGELQLKKSSYISKIIIPPDSLTNPKNPNRISQYSRYISQANLTNYPLMALVNALGLTSKGNPLLIAPPLLKTLEDYATKENTPIKNVQDQCLLYIFKYGLAGLKIDIANNASTNLSPRILIILGRKIVDCQTYKKANILYYEFVLIDSSKQIFNLSNKSYQNVKLYTVLGLDANNLYYEAVIYQQTWGTFDIKHPDKSETISLVYPEFYRRINFIPFVAINPTTLLLKWKTPYLQNLISLSLSIFSLEADLRQSLHMQSNSSLFICGANAKPSLVTQGMYSVNILKDTSAKALYISPQYGGILLQYKKLEAMKTEAIQQIYSIITASGSASGDALALRINAATTSLVNLVKTIGLGITRMILLIGKIALIDLDLILYKPYIGFSDIKSDSEIKELQILKINS